MSKLIIHNNSGLSAEDVLPLIKRVMDMGFISGPNQYCFSTTFDAFEVVVECLPNRGKDTHTFKVEDL